MSTDKTDAVIVGGGIIGSAAGFFLSKLGKRVIIIERDGVGTHASGFAYGALSPLGGAGIPGPILPLAIEGMKLHKSLNDSLREETGIDTDFHEKPTLTLAFDEEETHRLRGNFSWQQAQQGYKVGWLEQEALREIEPRVSSYALGGVYTEGTAEVDSYRLVLALTQAAEKHGAEYRHGRVVGLRRDGSKVTGVVTANGEILCDEVLLAMGPWAGIASQWLAMDIPIGPLKGQILRLQTQGPAMKCTIGWAGNYATTKPDGLLWAGTTEEEVGFDETSTVAARDQILSALLKMMPAMEDARLVQQTACLRPVSSDGLLLLGGVPDWNGVYIATGAGRKGILLGPIMAQIITDMVIRRDVNLPIEPFGMERFSSATG